MSLLTAIPLETITAMNFNSIVYMTSSTDVNFVTKRYKVSGPWGFRVRVVVRVRVSRVGACGLGEDWG